MALKRRNLNEDILWLKWPLVFLGLAILVVVALYIGSSLYRDEVRLQAANASANLEVISGQVSDIEESERVIIENIDRYNTMVANSVLDDEDRVGLLEEISNIRDKYQLFPIAVEISEQERILLPYPPEVEFPDEQISLRSSQVRIRLPLLHEEDLVRFLSDFMGQERLMVNNRCVIGESPVEDDNNFEVVEHQVATCEFYWYTLRNEPYSGV